MTAEIATTSQAYCNFRSNCLVRYLTPTFVGWHEQLVDTVLLREHNGTILKEFGYAQFATGQDLTAFLLRWS